MIPVVFITDNNFIMQTGVAITSLLKNKKADTEYDIYIIAAECESGDFDKLKEISGVGAHLNIIDASLEKYSDIKQLAHIPISCLLKFEICDMVKDYDKIIYLDGDICVRDDITELYNFDLGDNYIAGVPSIEAIHTGKKMINAGVALFNAKKMRDNSMSEKLIDVRKSLGDRSSMDQQTFNIVVKEKMQYLPMKYNFIPEKFIGMEKNKYPLSEINKLYGTDYTNRDEMNDDAVIVHFATGVKPWEYVFVPCADEWYDYYTKSVFKDTDLHRKNKMSYLITGALKSYRKNGPKGIIKGFTALVKIKLGTDKDSAGWG